MSNIEITETTQNLKIEDAGIQTIAIVEDQVSIIKINEGAAAVALAASADTILGLSAQVLSLDTQAANLGLFGPVSGAAAAPTFRSLVDADFPATLNPTLAGLGATPIVTSYTGPHCVGGSPTSAAQFFVTGSFTSTTSVFGWGFVSVLTPANLANRSATGVLFGPTLNMVANRTHPVFATLVIYDPTIISASGASVTEATTLRIPGAPTAGVSNYAINVVAGACRFGALTASLPVVTNADKVLTSLAYTGATSLRANLGLEPTNAPTFDDLNLYDTNASHVLTLHWNENEATASRTLNLVLGGADRTITLSGNPTLNDWFDQAVKAASSPSFAGLTLTAFSGAVIATAGVLSAGTLAATIGGTGQTGYAVGDLLYASSTTALSKLADVAVGAYLRSGGVNTAPLWSTLILPNAATAYRLPVATSANTIGELVAVGDTGQYLAGATGAIPVWTTLNQAAVAGLTTASSPQFTGLTLTGNFTVPDAGTIGLGSGKGLIQFDDEATDLISFMNCNVGVGISPATTFDILGSGVQPLFVRSTGTQSLIRFMTGTNVSRGSFGYLVAGDGGLSFLNAVGNAVIFLMCDDGRTGFGGTITPNELVELEQTKAITGAVTDGYSAALRIDPAYIGDGIVASISIGNGGTGYSVNDVLTVVQAGGSLCTVTVTSVTEGVVDGITLTTGGTGYAVANNLSTTVSPAGGTGCLIDIDTLTTRTVTRHNYIDVQDMALSKGAALTDAAVFRFDAAIGTHKAIDAASTKTTPSGVDAWMKVNLNGTIHYVPCYASKTA